MLELIMLAVVSMSFGMSIKRWIDWQEFSIIIVVEAMLMAYWGYTAYGLMGGGI